LLAGWSFGWLFEWMGEWVVGWADASVSDWLTTHLALAAPVANKLPKSSPNLVHVEPLPVNTANHPSKASELSMGMIP
jgi:hypothetical protein